MNTINKVILIVIVALAGIILITSCSKKSGAKGKKGKPAAVKTVKASDKPSDGKDSLNAVRNGQYVNLNWHVDTPAGTIKQISILRNTTGMAGKKTKVAELDSNATSFNDCLPDDNAYWYWVRLVKTEGKLQAVGPVRVDRDSAGAANYINTADGYKISITRTDELATLQWDFPEGEYKEIRIVRYPRLVIDPFKGKNKEVPVTVTVERKSQCLNALPDTNTDYWYWFQITMKSGAIIDRGPIKAEYAGQ